MASKRSALIAAISSADDRQSDGSVIKRLLVERIFAPVPVGWKIRVDTDSARRRLFTLRGSVIQSACAERGWRIVDHVSGWSARPPGPFTVGADTAMAVLIGELSTTFGRGEVAVVPTDTVYGLIAPLARTCGQREIAAAKHRAANRASQVLVNSMEQAESLARLSPQARAVIHRGWPGALTIVVDRNGHEDIDLGGDPSSIGLRWPDHRLCDGLISEFGPLIATSANKSGTPPIETADEAAALIREGSLADVGTIVDDGHIRGAASTVVDLRGDEPVLIREGALALSTIIEWWNTASTD